MFDPAGKYSGGSFGPRDPSVPVPR